MHLTQPQSDTVTNLSCKAVKPNAVLRLKSEAEQSEKPVDFTLTSHTRGPERLLAPTELMKLFTAQGCGCVSFRTLWFEAETVGASWGRSQEKGTYILEWEAQILACLTVYTTACKFLGHTVPHPSHLLNSSKTASVAAGTQKSHLRLPRSNCARVLSSPECPSRIWYTLQQFFMKTSLALTMNAKTSPIVFLSGQHRRKQNSLKEMRFDSVYT